MWRHKSSTQSGWSFVKAVLLTVLALSATTVQCADTVISCSTTSLSSTGGGAHTLSGSLTCTERTITLFGMQNEITVAGSGDVTITGLRFAVDGGSIKFLKPGGGTIRFVDYGSGSSTVSPACDVSIVACPEKSLRALSKGSATQC
jgi:hypothetical protein